MDRNGNPGINSVLLSIYFDCREPIYCDKEMYHFLKI